MAELDTHISLDLSKLPHSFKADLEDMRPVVKNQLLDFVQSAEDSEMAGWFNYPYVAGFERLKQVQNFINKYPYLYDCVVVVGSGGSYWGAKALYDFCSDKIDKKVFFCGNHFSSRQYQSLLKELDGKQPLVFNISLSGKTFETQVGSSLLWDYLKKRYKDTAKSRFFCINAASVTEELKAQPQFAEGAFQSDNLWSIQPNIGGRFSVFTEAAMLPLCFVGCDFESLLQGAQKFFNRLSFTKLDDPLVDYIALRQLAYQSGKSIELLSYNADYCSSYMEWQRQLFAESQGKDKKGLLPVRLELPGDLHSIGQWVQDGPAVSLQTFVEFEEDTDLVLPTFESSTPFDNSVTQSLSGSSLSSINKKILRSSYAAHSEQNIAARLAIQQNGLRAMGELMTFMMVANVVGANILGVDPYNQPGVESYKRIFKQQMQIS